MGQDFKDHFKKHPVLDVDKFFTHLEELLSSPQTGYWLTLEERDVVNRIHWDIYFSGEQRGLMRRG